ncbi:MAG: hypothetical protein ACRYFZ_10695 [Janthinobacterium lividum]
MTAKRWNVALLVSSLLVLVSCDEQATHPPAGNSQPAGTLLAQSSTRPPAEVVRRFYRWYLTEVYLHEPSVEAEGPGPTLAKNGHYQLDPTRHQRFLQQAGYFSPRFYANEAQVFKRCNQQLQQVSAKQVAESGSFAGELVKGPACDFLRWMVWTGGQGESLNTVKIKQTTLLADSAVVVAALGDSASGAAYEYSYPTVTLVQEKGEWKISRITIAFPATPSDR